MKQFFGKKKLAKLVTLSVMTGAMLGVASGAWAEAQVIGIKGENQTVTDNPVKVDEGQDVTYLGGDITFEHSLETVNGGVLTIDAGNVNINADNKFNQSYNFGILVSGNTGSDCKYKAGSTLTLTTGDLTIKSSVGQFTGLFVDRGYGNEPTYSPNTVSVETKGNFLATDEGKNYSVKGAEIHGSMNWDITGDYKVEGSGNKNTYGFDFANSNASKSVSVGIGGDLLVSSSGTGHVYGIRIDNSNDNELQTDVTFDVGGSVAVSTEGMFADAIYLGGSYNKLTVNNAKEIKAVGKGDYVYAIHALDNTKLEKSQIIVNGKGGEQPTIITGNLQIAAAKITLNNVEVNGNVKLGTDSANFGNIFDVKNGKLKGNVTLGNTRTSKQTISQYLDEEYNKEKFDKIAQEISLDNVVTFTNVDLFGEFTIQAGRDTSLKLYDDQYNGYSYDKKLENTINFNNVRIEGISETSDVIKNKGIINLVGGTYDENFVKDAKDSGTVNLKGTGVYRTEAGKVFTNGTVDGTDAGSVKTGDGSASAMLNFIAGTVALTDDNYILDYAKSAQKAMSEFMYDGSSSSKTQVVMLGKLKEFKENKINVEDAAKVGDDVALDKVVAESKLLEAAPELQGSLLVGTELSDEGAQKVKEGTGGEKGLDIKETINNGFSVAQVILSSEAGGMVVTNMQNVTVGGTGAETVTEDNPVKLVEVDKHADKKVNVVVGLKEETAQALGVEKTGVLNIGNSAVDSAKAQFMLDGSLIVNEDSEVNVKGQTQITEKVELIGGTANVGEGAKLSMPLFALDDSSAHVGQAAVVEAKEITVESTAKTNQSKKSVITGDVKASESLTMEKASDDTPTVLNVGTEDKQAKVEVKDTKLQDNMLFLDPAWKDGVGLEGASHYATETTNLDGAYVVGRNSILTFGATNADADDLFGSTDLNWSKNDISAAAYAAKNIDVTNGSLVVNGSLEVAPDMPDKGTVNFAAKSLFMVNGDNCQGSAAVTGVKSAEVADSSKLFIANAKPEKVYTILAGEGINSGWVENNVVVNGLIDGLTVELDATGNAYFKVTTGSIGFDVDDTVVPKVAQKITENTDSKAYEALYKMVDVPSAEQQTANVNAYANMGENLGVSRGAYDVANMVGNAVTEHWDNNAKGENIWAVYTHSKNKVDGMELGGMDAQYDAHYNGVVVGADLGRGFGIALNYADGNVSNGFGGHNDAEYYGAGLYARKAWGNFSLYFDAGYTYGKNELAQNGIEADAKTDTISAGLTAKYLAKAGKYDEIGLFAGARYMHIDGRDYTDSLGVNREADKINSVVVPVGLEYTGEFKMAKSEWTWKPRLAVGYLFNLGDRENDMTMRYGGAEDIFGYDFVDKGAFFTHAGMEFTKKNFSLGISYDFMKSKNSKNNRWNVNADVAF